MLKVGYFQFRPLFGQVRKNLLKVLKALEQVEADLIVLPELAFTGYYFQDRSEAMALGEDPANSDTIDTLINLCKARDLYIVSGFAERQNDKLFNSSILLGPEGIVHSYRKIHLFSEEQNCFDPGDRPLQVDTVRGQKLV